MKKIINGKMYNTETARCVGSWWNGCNTNDFHHCSEGLYRKKTGEFFLRGDGGPLSKYREQVGTNSWSGGSAIIPLSEDEAREWIEQYEDADTYIELFGEPEE